MSNKHKAVVACFSFSDRSKLPQESGSLNKMIEAGNSTLLVLRKKQEKVDDVEVFNQISSLSQLSQEDPGDQSIIERNFFKKTAERFTDLFHNGSFKGVTLISNCD